jgi:aspartate carbamoyltransferase catalytic subunit
MNAKRHILRSQQFDRPSLEKLFAATEKLSAKFDDRALRQDMRNILRGRLMFAVFYEPSTRTRFSFVSAANWLGMTYAETENAREFSSAVKGETLEDTIHVLCQYEPDVIVLRHHETGAAERAAGVIDHYGYASAIINAGDGRGQHPTQALLDAYTIWRELKNIDGITVVIGGDLANGRTARSLVYLLSKFDGVKFIFLAPENLRMSADIISHLREHDIEFQESTDVREALAVADAVYWTRIQKERGGVNTTLDLTITPAELAIMKQRSVLLHPLPRVNEITKEVDNDPRAAYFRQVRNGMLIRMALLEELCI